ncbi:hypothetical protein HUJ04_003149 [Dendroctonus ponderosae]|nr:hypothetical protein HUJ04_003149 [Dendroctonus ponderosae]
MSIWFYIVFCATILTQNCLSEESGYVENISKVLQNVLTNYENETISISNAECVAQISLFLKNLFNSTGDDIWALKMIDASYKIPSGIFDLNMAWIGSHKECINIESKLNDIKGKYCLTTIGIDSSTALKSSSLNVQGAFEKMYANYKTLKDSPYNPDFQMALEPSVGICMPHKCNNVDLESIWSLFLSVIPWSVTCQTKESIRPKFTIEVILTICFFGTFVCLMVLSTLYDIVKETRKESPHQLLMAFSMHSNVRKLFRITKNSGEFACLNGIRVLSMMWVMFCHVFFTTLYGPLSNTMDLYKFLTDDIKSLIIANAPFSVDSFLVVTGLLVVYNFMKSQHQGKKFNIFTYFRHRYIRLTPPIIPIMLACMFLLPFFGSGPYYPELDASIGRPCRRSWWALLLHVQNYAIRLPDVCMQHAWYLNVDWQVYLVSPLFLLLLPKYPITGLLSMFSGIMASMGASFYITWDKELPASNLNGKFLSYSNTYYFKTHTRISPWLIGGLLGYVLAKIKLEKNMEYQKMPKWLIGVIWILVLAVLPACVFAGYDTQTSLTNHRLDNSFFNAFSRPAWGLCIAWIIFASSIGYGGMDNKFNFIMAGIPNTKPIEL